jgi:hypothetical protein
MKIYYHGDVDGLVGAVIFADFMKQHQKRTDLCFQYMSYSGGTFQWQKLTNLHGIDNAVIDFPFHPEADWWFDHHETSFGSFDENFIKNHKSKSYFTTREYETILYNFDKRVYESFCSDDLPTIKYPNGKHWKYDAKAPSAAKVVSDYLSETFSYKNEKLNEIYNWANIIDSAGYESAKIATDYSSDAIRLNSIMESYPKDVVNLPNLINLFLSGKTLHEVVSDPFYFDISENMKNKYIKSEEKMFKNGFIENDIFVSFIKDYDEEFTFPRYGIYNKNENCKHHIVAIKKENSYYLRVGANPFLKSFKNPNNIGIILSKYGGGGHAGVGSAEIKKDEISTRQVVDEIFEELKKGLTSCGK